MIVAVGSIPIRLRVSVGLVRAAAGRIVIASTCVVVAVGRGVTVAAVGRGVTIAGIAINVVVSTGELTVRFRFILIGLLVVEDRAMHVSGTAGIQAHIIGNYRVSSRIEGIAACVIRAFPIS